MANKDYYSILGVSKDATEKEISAAYRRMAIRYHPDHQQGKSEAEKKEAEEKFKECAEAAAVLKDPDKRRNYDQFGSAEGPGQMGGGFQGFDPMSFFRKMHSGRFGFGFGDSDDDGGFGSFGFNMGGSNSRQAPDINAPEDGSDVQTRISVTFKESVTGCTKEFDFDLDKECPECHGTGAEKGSKPEKCPHCHGNGQFVQVHRMGPMVSQSITTCPHCGGTGYAVKPCGHCHGAKRVDERRHVKVKIPAGFQDGQQLRLRGLGRCGLKGGANGNLYVVVRVQSSDLFERNENNDIIVKVFISPTMATFGGKVDVPTPYGYKKIKVAPGTVSGTRLKVAGAGVKSDSGSGDMYIDISVEPYSNLTSEQKELLEKLQKTETVSNFAGMTALKKAADEFYS